MTSFITEIANELHASLQTEINNLPEKIFRHSFLPLFCGETPPQEVTPGLWAAVAGNPFMPVNVIDEEGTVLFQVPSLFDRDAIHVSDKERQHAGLHHVIITMRQIAHQSVAQANNYLRYELNKRQLTRVSPALQERVNQFNVILKHYGKPLIVFDEENGVASVQPTASAEGSTTGASDGPELEYE